MTMTVGSPEVEVPEPPACPSWCRAKHHPSGNDYDLDEGSVFRGLPPLRQHIRHLPWVVVPQGPSFNVGLAAYEEFRAGRWGRDAHHRPRIHVGASGKDVSLKTKKEWARFLEAAPFMYPELVDRVREAGAMLGWVE